MDPKAAVVMSTMIASVLICATIVYAWVRWLHRPQAGAAATPDQDARLERIERSIEAIAVEMERIGEGQRFTTKLLGERARAEAAVLRAPAYRPTDTPH